MVNFSFVRRRVVFRPQKKSIISKNIEKKSNKINDHVG